MKGDFKQCMEELRIETYARNEAETMVKVLKETINVQNNLKESEKVVEMEVDNSSEVFDTGDGEWKQQRSQKKNLKKRNRGNLDSDKYGIVCKICSSVFKTKEYMATHEVKHEPHSMFGCTECEQSYRRG